MNGGDWNVSPQIRGNTSNLFPQLTTRMDDILYESSSSSPRSNARHNISVRQPVSCEPCRHRKIKCSRTRPICDTCRRRRVNCLYKGPHGSEASAPASSSNEALLERIKNLERLLQSHTGPDNVVSNATNNQGPSPSLEMAELSQLSPESLISEGSTMNPTFSGHGSLITNPNGNVRYEPRSSQWDSVLANTNLSIATPSLEDHDESSHGFGFPFCSTISSTTEELLEILPPMQQCDYLKNQYFTVFSPVSLPLSFTNIAANSGSSSTFFMIQVFMNSMPLLLSIRLPRQYRG